MQKIAILAACMACTCNARSVQAVEKQDMPVANSFARVLMAFNPALAPGVGRVGHAHKRASSQMKALDVKEMSGITEPLGFFDPAGFSNDISDGRLRFYREVELKHGRLGMLAALGFVVAEQFHPLFGGDIDAPSYLAFQQTPLEQFWGLVVGSIAIAEIYSVFTFNNPAGGEPWSIREDHKEGDYLFDPLNLAPTDPEEFKQMRNKELNNGRLAMLAAAGMIAQELVTGQKLF